ncbi:unnamed protein product [Mytilus coruscus]|uniref:Uncharacterized protein n=1 Tax=Mytilus coruscus TaxID=42192 RepID=A0A6J8CP82_MYTCO|nr:unnamed protein product [Mytilus coruscus]
MSVDGTNILTFKLVTFMQLLQETRQWQCDRRTSVIQMQSGNQFSQILKYGGSGGIKLTLTKELMSTESAESDTDIGEEIAHELEEPQINMAAAVPSIIPFPQKLDLDGNIATNWRKFKRTWDNYEIASGLSEKDAKLRTATLLTCEDTYIADTLSRAYLNNGNNKSEKQDEICHVRSDIEMELENINMGDYLAISAKRQKDIADATMKDPILLKLIDKVSKRWTEINIQQDIAPYYHIRDELSIQGELEHCYQPNLVYSKTELAESVENVLKKSKDNLLLQPQCEDLKQLKRGDIVESRRKVNSGKGFVTNAHSARSYDLEKKMDK